MPLSEKQREITQALINFFHDKEILTVKELWEILEEVKKEIITLEDIPF